MFRRFLPAYPVTFFRMGEHCRGIEYCTVADIHTVAGLERMADSYSVVYTAGNQFVLEVLPVGKSLFLPPVDRLEEAAASLASADLRRAVASHWKARS